MCKQALRTCLNLHCDGFAQILPLVPCENRPNCDIVVIRIPSDLRSAESYCPNCKDVTPRQRKTQYEKARRAGLSKPGTETLKAENNGADDEAHAGVGQQTESSRIGESRGAIGGGFPDSADPFSTSAEPEESYPLPDENSFVRWDERSSELPSEMATDAPANEEFSIPGVTHGPHESSQGPISNEDPRSQPPNSVPASSSQTPASPTLSSLITWFQADMAEMDIATRLTHVLNPLRDPDAAPILPGQPANPLGLEPAPQLQRENPPHPALLRTHADFSDGVDPQDDEACHGHTAR